MFIICLITERWRSRRHFRKPFCRTNKPTFSQKLGCQFLRLAILALCAPTLATAAQLEFKRCTVSSGASELDAECATLERHENPQDSNSRLIDLAVVKFPSHSPEPETDAFTVIQGGPGGSSVDFAIAYNRVFDEIRRKRDIIVIDQRGTGRSNLLNCELPEDTSTQFDIELSVSLTKQCVSTLSKHSDLRFYTTSVAVEDLEALRLSTGYSQLNIYGVSYGTRVAQHYLRKYPEHTRAVILDGVVQVGLNLAGGEIARRWEDSFVGLNTRCQQDTFCKTTHGDLHDNYQAVQARLSEQEITVSVPHPQTGKITEQSFNEFSLLSAMRLMAYSTEHQALMPLLLSEAKRGNYSFLASQIIQVEDMFAEQFATGMHNTVMCAEDAPFVQSADIAQAKGTLVGAKMSEILRASCTVWPRGPIDQDFRKPFSSEKPVLILSGETDPITPPANGDVAAKMLANSKHIVVPSHGHGVLMRGCMPKLASNFIENASFEGVDETCTQREKAMPIFTNLVGPRP